MNSLALCCKLRDINKAVVPDKADPRYRKLVQIWNQLILQDGRLWRYFEGVRGTGGVYQLVVPLSLKEVVLKGVQKELLVAILELRSH